MALAALPASAAQRVRGGPAISQGWASQLAADACYARGGDPANDYWYWQDGDNWYAYVTCQGI
ncbi:hypothetical protein [Streptomyces sp. NPDC057623]|uniref:hypothetical protein n=1 Tax=Streptomyces sp. NPDC057623 TaxID=3346187 RepID=UPI0036A6F7F5